jgi:hypothetical protein
MVDIRKSKLFPFPVDEEVALRRLFESIVQDSSLNDLSDVVILNPADGEVLKYNATLMAWENAPESGGGGGSSPGGTGTQLQFRSSSTVFGGIAGTAWDGTILTLPGSLQIGASTGAGTRSIVGLDELTIQYNHPTDTGSYAKLEMGRTGSTETGWTLEAIGDSGGDTATFTFTSGSTTPEFNGNLMWHAGNFSPSSKQDTLVSGTNIKTINSTSLLGSGDIAIAAGPAPVVTESGTNRNISNTDAGAYIRFTNTGAKTATFGTGVTTTDAEFNLRNAAASGNLTITPSSTTINGPTVIAPGETATVKLVATSTFDVIAGDSITADNVSYDNTTSGLIATDVQAAIDEVAAVVGDFTFADSRFSWYGYTGNVLGVPPFPNGTALASGNTGGTSLTDYAFSVGIRSSASANSGYVLSSNGTNFSTNNCIRCIVVTNSTISDRVIRVGCNGGVPAVADPTDGFYVEFQSGGTAILRARASSTSTDSATTYTFASNTAYMVDLIVLSATSVVARIRSINGSLLWEETLTSGMPTSADTFRWFYSAWRITGGSNADVCHFVGHGIGPTVPSWM